MTHRHLLQTHNLQHSLRYISGSVTGGLKQSAAPALFTMLPATHTVLFGFILRLNREILPYESTN